LVNKNVLNCLLKVGREVDAVTLVGRLFHACATVTRNDRSPMVLSGGERTGGRGGGEERGGIGMDRAPNIFPKSVPMVVT